MLFGKLGLIDVSLFLQKRLRAYAESESQDQGLRCPLTESLDTIECINEEQMPR